MTKQKVQLSRTPAPPPLAAPASCTTPQCKIQDGICSMRNSIDIIIKSMEELTKKLTPVLPYSFGPLDVSTDQKPSDEGASPLRTIVHFETERLLNIAREIQRINEHIDLHD
jgi:hypothetical protein